MVKEFELTDKEYEMACDFAERHRHREISKGAIGGHLTVSYTLTSLGTFPSIKCSICGEEENITDYGSK